jgi:hypothetical protein
MGPIMNMMIATPTMKIMLITTIDDAKGPCPPAGDGWTVARSGNGHTTWRRIFLAIRNERVCPLRSQPGIRQRTQTQKAQPMKTQNTNENEQQNNLGLAVSEAEAIHAAAAEDVGFAKMLKFKKGEYFIDEIKVPAGTEYLVHVTGWTKAWIKFIDDKVVDRKHYRVTRGERPVDRNDLDELELAGTDEDPWSLQSMLPFEDMERGEVFIFTTSSFGGKRAVAEICDAYAKRKKRGQNGQPVVQLATATMPTKNFGPVPRPHFEIARWDDTAEFPVLAEEVAKDDMDDEVPF